MAHRLSSSEMGSGGQLPSAKDVPDDHLVFVPVAPCRLMDTRAGFGFSGPFGPPTLSAGVPRPLPVTYSCGVSRFAQAAMLNLTTINVTAQGSLVVFPNGAATPLTSNLNFDTTRGPISNLATAHFNNNGEVAFVSSANTDLIVEVYGYYIHPSKLADGVVGNVYRPMSPCRISDTRVGSGFFGDFGLPKLQANQTRNFPITGSCSIPIGITGVLANLTITNTEGEGFIDTYATGTNDPQIAQVMYKKAGQTKAHYSFLGLSAASGETTVRSGVSATDLITDVSGYFQDYRANFSPKYYFIPVTPCRMADTRTGSGLFGDYGPPSLGASQSRFFWFAGRGCGIPLNAKAVSLNFTAINPSANGLITVSRSGQNPPYAAGVLNNTSTLNYSSSDPYTTNSAVIDLRDDGSIEVNSSAATDLTIDVDGYFVP